MRRYVEEQYRPVLINTKRDFEMGVIQRGACKTDRPELLVAVARFQEERTEEYKRFRALILPILLHPRHDHIRFSNKPGEKGFYVNQQALNSSVVMMESVTAKGRTVMKSVVPPIFEGGIRAMSDAKFRKKSMRVRGLLGLLKNVFWPTYNTEVHASMARSYLTREKKRVQARRRAEGKKNTRKKKKPVIQVAAKDRRSSSGCAWSTIDSVIHNRRGTGMELGKQIHEQLERFARDHISFALSRDPVDPITRAVIDHIIIKWKMIPVWGELQIWDEGLRYGTAIDMVCLRPKGMGNLVFLEIKTGYKEVFTYARRKVHGGVGIDDSPLGHAMLQLIIPIQTMKYRYGITGITGYVLHVNEMEGVTCFKLPADNPRVKGGVSYARIYNYAMKRDRGGPQEPGLLCNKRKRGGDGGGGGRGKTSVVARSSPLSIVSARTQSSVSVSSARPRSRNGIQKRNRKKKKTFK